MKYNKLITTLGLILILCSCATKHTKSENDLIKFAKANCFYWYFKSKDIDTSEIRKITIGVVEMSTFSAEKFQKVAFLVKSYSPNASTKNNVNNDLSKCFSLDSDNNFLNKINTISKL